MAPHDPSSLPENSGGENPGGHQGQPGHAGAADLAKTPAPGDRPPTADDGEAASVVRSVPRLVLILATIVLLSEIVPLQLTLVYPATRDMAKAFHTTDVAWTLTIVTLVGAVIMPLVGKLADIHGKKRVVMAISGCFAIGSLLCALTDSFSLMLVGRALQGTALASTAVTMGLIRDVTPRRWVPLALGASSTGLGLSAIAGPFVGGALLDHFGYRGIFWFCFIFIAVLAPVLYIATPESAERNRHRLDWFGAVVLGAGVGLVLLGVSQGPEWGWTGASTLASIVGGAVLVAVFAVYALRARNPLIDVRMVAGPRMRTTLIAALAATVPITGWAFLLPFMAETPHMPGLHYGFGLSATDYAWLILPQGIVGMAVGPLGGMLGRARNPRLVLQLGMVGLTAAMVLVAFLHTHKWEVFLIAAVQGVGFGFYYAAVPNLISEAVPASEMSTSSGMLVIAQSMSSAITTTVLGVILAQNVHLSSAEGVVYSDHGFLIGWIVAAGCGVIGLVVSLCMRHGTAPAVGGATETSAAAPARPAAHVA